MSRIAPDQAPSRFDDDEGDRSSDEAPDLAAARGGDHEAFARLYDRHAAVVLSLCRRRVGAGFDDLAEAEDAAQETFIRAYRQLHTLESPSRFRAWLFGIARRVCSERRRAAGRRRRHEDRAMTIAGERRSQTSRDDDVEQHEELERLDAALQQLPEPERLAIHLYYIDPDPVRAAGDALGLSRSGFYKLLARAREHLARRLSEAHAQ